MMARDRMAALAFETMLLALAAGMLVISLTSGWRFHSMLMPAIFSGFATLMIGLVLIRDTWRYSRSFPDDKTFEEERGSLRANVFIALRFFGWIVASIAAVPVIGFLPTIFAATASFMLIVGRTRWWHAVVAAAVTTLIAYAVYDKLVHLIWPRNLLSNLIAVLGG